MGRIHNFGWRANLRLALVFLAVFIVTTGAIEAGKASWRFLNAAIPVLAARQLNVTRIDLPAAICQNATAITGWSTPTTNPAVAACVTGTNTQRGVLDFADGANTLSAQTQLLLPADWLAGVDVRLVWFTTATAGNVVWQVATICVADAETGDPAFNTASTVTDAAKGTTLQHNDAAITGLTMTGCAAGETLFLRVFRDPANASDTLAATARLVAVELAIRKGV